MNVLDNKTNINYNLTGKYLFATDGFHSLIRKKLGIAMTGYPKLQSFMNIFFESKKLAENMKNKKENTMLHFIYNSDVRKDLNFSIIFI